MRKKYFRRVSVVICTILSILLLSGCSLVKKKRIPTISERDMYQEKQLTPATLTLYLPGYEPDGAKKVLAEIEKQLRPTLNVKLNFHWIHEGVYSSVIQGLMDSSKPLDAFIISKDTYNDGIGDMADKGKLLDITSYLMNSVPALYEMYSREAIKNVTYDGKAVAVPSLLPSTNRITASIPVNQAQYSKIDTPDIKTFDDVNQFISQYHGIETDKSSVELFADAAGYVDLGYGFVYKSDDPLMKVIPWEQTQEFKNAVKTIDEWQKKHYCKSNYMIPSGERQNKKSTEEMFSTIPPFYFTLTTWNEVQRWIHQYGRDEAAMSIMPLYMDKTSTISLDTKAIAIPKNSKNGERLLKFLQWIQSGQEHYDLLVYGIKGENYNLENDIITFPKDKQRYFGWDGCEVFMNKIFVRDESIDVSGYKDTYKSLIEKAKYPPTTGFRINKAKIQVQLDKRKNAFDDFEFRLRSPQFGNADTEIEKFMDEQKNFRVDGIVSELQKQLNEWVKDTH